MGIYDGRTDARAQRRQNNGGHAVGASADGMGAHHPRPVPTTRGVDGGPALGGRAQRRCLDPLLGRRH